MSHKMIVICLKIYKPYYQVRELLTLCWLTADWVADLYSQSSHLKGFSPVCCLMWSFNLSLDGRRFAHTEQVYSNNDKCLCFLIMKMKNDCMLCFIALLMDFYFGKFIGDVLTYADWTLSLLETFCHTSRIDIRHTLHRSSPRALHYNAITIEGKWFRYNGVRFTKKTSHKTYEMTIKKTYLPHSGAAGPILFWVATFKCTVISSINGIFSPGWLHSWGWDTVTIPLMPRKVFHTFVTPCTLKTKL